MKMIGLYFGAASTGVLELNVYIAACQYPVWAIARFSIVLVKTQSDLKAIFKYNPLIFKYRERGIE